MIIIIIVLSVLVLLALTAFLLGITDFHFHGKRNGEKLCVACVGDSITNAAFTFGCFFRAYPARLQRLLGGKYQVENYGLNDRTLQSTGNKPYIKEKDFKRSLALEPDIAVIFLGTNDSKPFNWVSEEHFISEYKSLLQNYTELKKPPKIIICTPTWSVDARNVITRISNDVFSEKLPTIAECVKRVGEECSLLVIDLYSLSVGKRELLCFDGVHPSGKGSAFIAREVYAAIKGLNKKPE